MPFLVTCHISLCIFSDLLTGEESVKVLKSTLKILSIFCNLNLHSKEGLMAGFSNSFLHLEVLAMER